MVMRKQYGKTKWREDTRAHTMLFTVTQVSANRPGRKGKKRAAVANAATAAAAGASSVHGGATAVGITITPQLPSIRVSADGGAVFFQDEQLHTMDQLVMVLLGAYGYAIQHFNEEAGKVFFTLAASS